MLSFECYIAFSHLLFNSCCCVYAIKHERLVIFVLKPEYIYGAVTTVCYIRVLCDVLVVYE